LQEGPSRKYREGFFILGHTQTKFGINIAYIPMIYYLSSPKKEYVILTIF
jgi:hypothetical protein